MEPWMTPVLFVGVLFFLWILINLKKSRPDGTYLKVHPFRTMLTFIMPTRNESVVYFDEWVPADNLLQYIEDAKDRFHLDVTHVVVGACATGLWGESGYRMNRFTVGRRLYQRKGVWLSFSMKRKKLDREAKLAAIKMQVQPGETFKDFCHRINQKIGIERSDAKTYSDKEFDLLLRMPRPILNVAVRLCYWLDYHNLLPGSFIKADAMYTSMFIANLGSLDMRAGYHHLYEWGNCPLFVMLGRIEERPVVENGQVVAKKMLHIRFSYDERIDDGFTASFGIQTMTMILENPATYLGCLKEDGSDAYPLDQGPARRLKPRGTRLVLEDEPRESTNDSAA